MKIIYILKKGLQVFPPCLTQVLAIDDMGIPIVVFHGKNSIYINKELDRRGIQHYTLKNDKDNNSKIDRIINFYDISREINGIVSSERVDSNVLFWFGNVESAIAVKKTLLERIKFAISVLELYEEGIYIEKQLKKIISKAQFLVACEPHRAEIMRVRYKLNRTPYIMPNKPYDCDYDEELSDLVSVAIKKLEEHKNNIKLIYQGVVQKNRPLEQISKALSFFDNENLYFVVMGKCDKEYMDKLLSIYPRTLFLGYIPAPEHLTITKLCDVGIANYDFSILNTIFCAPNKIYEYSKYGIPILATNNTSLRETVGQYKAGECVDFSDYRSIEAGLRRVLDQYSYYKKNALEFYNSVNINSILGEIVKKERLKEEN